MRAARVLPLAVILVTLGACEGGGGSSIDEGPVNIDITESAPEVLSAMRILDWDATAGVIRYNERVVPYELNTELFSDFSLKARAIYVPEGETIAYDPERPLDLPIGSVIVKTFSFPADFRQPDQDITLIETRVLRRTVAGWEAWPYIWNAEQTEATLELGGETRTITFTGSDGGARTANYLVPQRNQCRSCHERNESVGGDTAITPIGPAARYLNRDNTYGGTTINQLEYLVEQGMLSGLPAIAEVPAAFDFSIVEASGVAALADTDVEPAARSYLDVNCAHCHDPLGPQGVTSQLFLNHDNDDTFRLGVCKRPGSAGAGTGGLTYDLVPGSPDESILVFRVETTEVGAMMPLLGRSLQHNEGAALIRRWVADMDPVVCDM